MERVFWKHSFQYIATLSCVRTRVVSVHCLQRGYGCSTSLYNSISTYGASYFSSKQKRLRSPLAWHEEPGTLQTCWRLQVVQVFFAYPELHRNRSCRWRWGHGCIRKLMFGKYEEQHQHYSQRSSTFHATTHRPHPPHPTATHFAEYKEHSSF